MPILLLILETFFLYKLYEKYKFSNCIVLIYTIVYFYCNAILFDIYLFSNTEILKKTFVFIDYTSDAFDSVFISYFLFLFSYFLFFYFDRSLKPLKQAQLTYQINISNIVIYTLVILLFIFSFYNLQYDRATLKEEGGVLRNIVNGLLLYSPIFILFYSYSISKKNIFILFLAFALFCISSYEREPLILLGIVFLFYFRTKINILFYGIITFIGIVVLTHYKAFSGIVLRGGDWYVFISYIKNNPISLAALDPLASFSILYDYFYSKPLFYTDYSLSYFTSFYDQFMKYYWGKEIYSLGQAASNYYVKGEYGVAFSMILESILNFSFFGPIIFAYITKLIYHWLYRTFYYIPTVIDIIYIMIFLSLIRTELMVIIKVLVVPILVFLIILHFLHKKRMFRNLLNTYAE